jgi:hypothetical protein
VNYSLRAIPEKSVSWGQNPIDIKLSWWRGKLHLKFAGWGVNKEKECITLLSSSYELAIEIYSLPVSTVNGIKFRFQFIKMSDRDLKFVYLFCQTDMFLFVIETPIGKFKHPFSKLVGTNTCKTWNIKSEIYY